MNKIIKTTVITGLLVLGFFVGGDERAEAATANCLSLHAGFCRAAGLNYGVNTSINFEAVKAALEAHYNKYSAIFGWSYMEYKGGHWYWVCVNMDIIQFSGVPAPCTPSWGSYGACSESCGGGTQTRVQSCTGAVSSRACNTQPCCGPADDGTYETGEEVIAAGRCNGSDAVVGWLEGSNPGLAANNGIGWKWKCNDGATDSNQCKARKPGVCATVAGMYEDPNDACDEGLFNSVRLTEAGLLVWRCGTGGATESLGSFISDNPDAGTSDIQDDFGPSSLVGNSGGTRCQCKPEYIYECVPTGEYDSSCEDNCGGTVKELVQVIKSDTKCFPNNGKQILSDKEYNEETGKHCVGEVKQCHCGAGENNSQGGIWHETN